MNEVTRTLTVAGSDSGGGAGIQADLKTFAAFGTYGMSVLTALTAQNTLGVHGVHHVPASFVRAQFDAVVGDIGVDAVKTGMLGSAEAAAAVVEAVVDHRIGNLVVDPVCASKHGDLLIEPEAVDVLREQLLPRAAVVTPNTGEVAVLTGVDVKGVDDMVTAARAVKSLGPRWVVIKGGHLPDNTDAVDLLHDGREERWISAERLDTHDTHGTGCTFAAGIAAGLGGGLDTESAVRAAKEYVTGAIRHGLRIGGGIGPVDHQWRGRRA